MAQTGTVMTATPQDQTVDRGTLQLDRLFYVVAASIMVIVTAVGFRGFLLQGKGFGGGDMTSQIVPLIVVHGLAMFSWVIFFFIQSVLILIGNRRLHMAIGPVGGVIAATIVILGSVAASLSVRFNPELYKPFGGARFFLVEMLTEMLLFGALVAIGLKYRRRPEVHRPVMLLATISIIGGSLGRCPYIGQLALLPPLYAYVPPLLFGALLFLIQWGMTRAANRWYAIGYAGIVLVFFVSVALGNTMLWNQMVGTFVP